MEWLDTETAGKADNGADQGMVSLAVVIDLKEVEGVAWKWLVGCWSLELVKASALEMELDRVQM